MPKEYDIREAIREEEHRCKECCALLDNPTEDFCDPDCQLAYRLAERGDKND